MDKVTSLVGCYSVRMCQLMMQGTMYLARIAPLFQISPRLRVKPVDSAVHSVEQRTITFLHLRFSRALTLCAIQIFILLMFVHVSVEVFDGQ